MSKPIHEILAEIDAEASELLENTVKTAALKQEKLSQENASPKIKTDIGKAILKLASDLKNYKPKVTYQDLHKVASDAKRIK